MLFRDTRSHRSGATLVESSLVLGVTFLLVFGLIVLGLGVSRYQQTAAVTREAARWASVHGGMFAQETGQPAATPDDVQNQVLPGFAPALDPKQIKAFTVTWDDASKMPTYFDAKNQVQKSNAVHVTISYQWVPEVLLGGVTLTSTSEMPMSY